MESEKNDYQPEIAVAWSLEPNIHSFSGDRTPTLSLSLTNRASRPITFYNEHLCLTRVLAEGHLIIFDYTSNSPVDQTKTRFCDFAPPSKIHVPLRERLFYTLYPGEPLVFSATFGISKTLSRLKGTSERPQSRGVNGLEIGHQYGLRPGKGWGRIRWWEYGEKEEVMNPPGGILDGRTIAYKHHKTPHPGFNINVMELPEIRFECVE
ncbi:MAG: hypothetical protein Q9170_007442 [Blastenia crenularia]